MIRSFLREVPPGYALHRVGSTWLVLDTQLRRELIGLRLADPAARDALFSRAQRRGRGRTPTVQLPSRHALVLRRYRHGGLLGQLTRAWLWGPRRALREFEITVRAERARAPVPHVACVAVWPVAGPLWSALIGTLEVEGSDDLLRWLQRSETAAGRRTLARHVGAAIRRLHDTGIEHRDLQLRNILVRWDGSARGAPQIVVIDLDGARHHGLRGVPPGRRADNLGRLLRSAIKLGLWGSSVGRRECAAFLRGYLRQGRSGRDRGSRELRRALRRYAGLERFKLAWHQLGYRLRARRPSAPPPARGAAALRAQDASARASSTSITGMPSSMA